MEWLEDDPADPVGAALQPVSGWPSSARAGAGAIALACTAALAFLAFLGIGFDAGTAIGGYRPGLSDLPPLVVVLPLAVAFLATLSLAGAVVLVRRAFALASRPASPGAAADATLGRVLAALAAVALVPVTCYGMLLLANPIGAVVVTVLGAGWLARQGRRERRSRHTAGAHATIRRVDAATTRPLRQAVLRPHQRPEDLVYPSDDAPDAGHFAAFVGKEVVGCASVHRDPYPGTPDDGVTWRLRGMATVPAVRGAGVGGRLLTEVIAHAGAQGGRLLWCNARVAARGFYERYGFAAVGEMFKDPDTGPHFRMTRPLP